MRLPLLRLMPPLWILPRSEKLVLGMTESDKFAMGIEWDEPRDFSQVEVEVGPTDKPRASDFWLEYWVSSWPSTVGGEPAVLGELILVWLPSRCFATGKD